MGALSPVAHAACSAAQPANTSTELQPLITGLSIIIIIIILLNNRQRIIDNISEEILIKKTIGEEEEACEQKKQQCDEFVKRFMSSES